MKSSDKVKKFSAQECRKIEPKSNVVYFSILKIEIPKLCKETQNEYDALHSFAYNIGSLNKLIDNDNRSKSEIFKSLLEYNNANINGKYVTLHGLVKRRAAEAALFTVCDYSTFVNDKRVYYKINNEFYINKLREIGVINESNTKPNTTTSNSPTCYDGNLTGECINDDLCDKETKIKCSFPKNIFIDNYENNGIFIPTEQCDENTNTIPISTNDIDDDPFEKAPFLSIGKEFQLTDLYVYDKFYS
ncbi:hypothetical protein H8356DRAFT_1359248 [Neocallimastix lanati (nom. inval.)]|nr:hypothetical protein H8356DRAFT_1359248 [Neocallimastix sp. JGI-2020a]